MGDFVDLVDLDDIGEQSVLQTIEKRFQKNEIYSSLGTILIAVNPYKDLRDLLYSPDLLEEMLRIDHTIDPNMIFRLERPHVWMIARNAFLQLQSLRSSQAIVISGESGAGKTETTKKCLQYLSSLAVRTQHDLVSSNSRHSSSKPPPPPPPPPSLPLSNSAATAFDSNRGEQKIEDKILATNPVLESFGNAKTAKNNNSSRFGKWIQINYSYLDGASNTVPFMVGGEITQYLLEKSRVVIHAPDERNYHIFYQLCASGILDLQPAASYRYLRYSKSMKIQGVDDKAEFQDTWDSMGKLGFTEPAREAIFASLKGILLFGNIIFTEDNKTGMSTISTDYQPLVVSIAKIFAWNAETIPQRFVTRSITVRGEQSTIQLNTPQAQDAVNALAKEIYSRIFNYIVYQANQSLISTNSSSLPLNNNKDRNQNIVSIGLLDIFGFEKFKFNSFEQLCINYANEKLQQYFINYVLKKEQDLYRAEGIDTAEFMISILDNADVLQLFEGKKNGIFARLDDEIKLPKAKDETFLKKIESDHNNQKDSSRRFIKDVKMPVTQFEIRHFAGMIRYDCVGFLEKNRDKLNDNLEELFYLSENVLFRRIMIEFSSSTNADGGGDISQRSRSKDQKESAFTALSSSSTLGIGTASGASMSITTRFQSQLQQLVDILNASQPHFIKCVKPNNLKQDTSFEKDLVLAQLKYSGVLEAIQIRRSGYPVRRSHELFWKNYWMLVKGLHRSALRQMNDLEKCELIIQKLSTAYPAQNYDREIKVGRTLIFCKSKMLQLLEEIKQRRVLFVAVRLQSYCRQLVAKKLLSVKQLIKKQITQFLLILNSEDHCNDFGLINSCQSLIDEGEDYDLPRPLIQSLVDRQKHLMQIKQCYEKLEFYSTQQPTIKGPPVSHQQSSAQILAEFQELQGLLSVAQQNRIESPHIPAAQARLESLRERAELVEQLLKLLEQGDDAKIVKHLSRIEEIAATYGKFCEEEIARGKSMLKLIQQDKKGINEIFEYLKKYVDIIFAMKNASSNLQQIRNSNRLPVGAAAATVAGERTGGEQVDSKAVAMRLEDCNQWLAAHLIAWAERSIAFKPYSLCLRILNELVSLQSNYIDQRWSDLVQQLQVIRQTVSKAELLSVSLENDGPVLSSKYELLQKIILVESALMSQDLQMNYLIPKLTDLLSVERIPFARLFHPTSRIRANREDVDDYDLMLSAIEENNQLLVNFMEEMNNFAEVFIPKEICVNSVRLIQRLIEARLSLTDERWEQVILLSETVESKIFRLQTINEWYYEIKLAISSLLDQTVTIGEAFFFDANSSIENIEMFYQPFEENKQYSSYLTVCSLMRNQFHLLFSIGLERYLQIKANYILVAALPVSRDLSSVSHASRYETVLLEKTIESLRKLLSYFFNETLSQEEAKMSQSRSLSPAPSLKKIERSPSKKETVPNVVTLSNAMKLVFQGCETVVLLRRECSKQSWNQVMNHWEAKQFDDYLYAKVSARGVIAENMTLVKEEIVSLMVYGCNQYLHTFMMNQIAENFLQFSEVVNSLSKTIPQEPAMNEAADFQHEALELINRRIVHLKAMSSEFVTAELEELADFVRELLKARHFLQRGYEITACERSLQSVRTIYEQMKERAVFSCELSEKIENEFEEMKLIIEGRTCMTMIWNILETNANAQGDNTKKGNEYLLAYVPNQNAAAATSARTRTASTSQTSAAISSPVPARLKSLSFDLGLSSPLLGSQVSSTQIEDVLKSDGFMLHDAALDTESLESACCRMRDFKESLEFLERESPSELLQWARAIEGIKYVRECVLKGEWIIAQRIVQELEHLEVLSRFPTIEREVKQNKGWINNYAVITCCLNALCKAPPNNTGLIGQPEYFKNVSTELLEEAMKLCQAIGRPSKRAEVLFNAVLTILDLRRAQKLGDWTEIRAVLTRAYADNIGAGMSDICFAEINRAIIERDNYDGIQGLKAAVINEEMCTKDSVLDIAQISTKDLSAAIGKVASMPEDTRGMVLKALYGLADTIFKARKAVQQKNWYVLENLLPVLRDNSESLQNELDSNQKGNVQRKTMFRTSSFHRGTILNNKEKRMTAVDAVTANNNLRGSLWEEFTEVSQSIKREIKAIEHHFAVMELDKQLNEALTTGNITCDEVTGQITKSSITVEELREAVDQATNLELSTHSLPKNLKLLRKVGLLIIDIRQGVLNDKWDTMSSLLEETLDNDYSIMPEMCRLEIQAVRKEVENRWIVTNLSNALLTGKLNGTVNDVELHDVSYSHLSSYISTAKSLHPFTDEAFKLIASAERVAKLREMIVDPPTSGETSDKEDKLHLINWNQVKRFSKELLDDLEKSNSKLHKLISTECKLTLDVAEDRLTRDFMEQALTNGGPSGEPGRIVITNMSTHQLEKAYQQAVRSSLKTDRAKQLLLICRSVQKLREALLRAESANTHREAEVEAWKTIRSLLQEIDESKKQQLQQQHQSLSDQQEQQGWDICNQEIDLIQKHSIVQDLKNGLIDSAVRASHVYYERHQLNLHIDLTKYDTAQSLELKQLCVDLDSIIQQALNLSFSSDHLQKYIACATTLRLYRSAILDGNWVQLEILIRDHSFQSNLNVLPETKQELAWILCELHNNLAINALRSALEIQLFAGGISTLSSIKESATVELDNSIYTKEWDLKMLHGVTFAKRNEQLKQAIQQAKQYKITSKLALQWLECCENMYLLRGSLELRDNMKVAQALRWFKANAKTCPEYIKLEAQRAYVIHQNDLLLHGLTFALSHGKPTGKCGAINTQLIETQAIEDLLKQANEIKPKLAEVEDLINAAKIALMIRHAVKTKNIAALKDIIADLSLNHDDDGTAFSLLIIDEIAIAKGELDNEIAIQALTKALKSFEDAESKSLDLTFTRVSATSTSYDHPTSGNSLSFSVDQDIAEDSADEMIQSLNMSGESSSIDLVEFPSPNSKRFHSSILESFSPMERRYSFANKNSTNIDLETIDIDILDYGLRVAKDHGIYSDRAKRLHATVELIKSLRLALKNSDWFLLEDVLTKSLYEENVGTLYDELAQKEIQTLRSQLLMRTAIVELSKALKTGWAQCAHGIVDTSKMQNDLLLTAIEKADHCMMELSQSTGTPTTSPIKSFYALSFSLNTAVDSSEEESAQIRLEDAQVAADSPSLKKLRDKGKESGVVRRKSVQFADEIVEANKKQTITSSIPNSSKVGLVLSSTTNSQKSTIEEQIKLLINSAKLIYHIRDILSTGNIESAGQLAEEALSKQMLHYTVIEELKLYSKEINTALLSLKLIETCKQSMGSGKLLPLEGALRMIFEKEIHYSSDLGIIYIIMKAEGRYRQLSSIKKRLIQAKSWYDLDQIRHMIQQAKQMNYCDVELEELLEYFQTLIYFQNKVYYLLMRWIFQNESVAILQEVTHLARQINFLNHPLTLQTQFLLQCNTPLLSMAKTMKCFTLLIPKNDILYSSLFSTNLSHETTIPVSTFTDPSDPNAAESSHYERLRAMKSFSLSYTIHGLITQSIQHKRLYLQLPSSQQKYRLENFAYLRTVNDFSFRMTIISEELKKSFLSYSEQPLPCSLTRLSPQLSAVAVYIYSQMIRGIERSLFTYPEVVVKQLVTIGCAVTLLRDEILIQLVKQIRHHPMPEKRKRSNFGYDVLHGLMSPTSTTSAGLNSYAHIVSKVQQQQQLQQFLQQNRLNEEDNLDDEDNLIRFIEKQEQYRGSIFSLWRLLMICLFHFPPSAEFENFLELFLWEQYDHYTKIIASFNQRYQQLRPLGDETADSLKRKLERKPFSMTDSNPGASTSQSSATGGEENVIEITNELEYYLYKNLRTYSMRCLRYLHRSILVNGYHQPVDLHQSSDTVSYGEVGSERENKLLPGRPNHHQYSLFPGDEQPFPAIFHWLQEGKGDHELPSISLNANHLYYPSNNAKIAAKEYSNASDSLASLQKKQRKNIQIYTFESLIDPSLPIFLLADEFNELHLPLSKQEPFYLSPLSQIYQRSESLIHEQFTKALLIQNDFVTALGLSTKKGKESETRSSFSNSAIALTMKMIVASSKEQTAEKVDGDCHLLLLAGATIDLISSDPAFQRITEPADKIVFDEQLLLALNRPPSQPSLPQLQQQLQQPNNSSFQKQPTVSSPALSSLIRLRGTREDWISRFRLLQITGKEGNPNGARSGFINRNQFCNALAATITSKASNVDLLDRMDRDILYFLLFGKKLSNRPTIVREYRADYHVFHFFGADEYASCQLRRKWLDDHIAVPNSMSELMLSQLQSTDLLYAAERFWDLVVVKMSKECLQFPFMQFDEVSTEESSSPDKNIAKRGTRLPTSSSSTNNVIVPSLGKDSGEGNGVSFNWEIYREIILTAMKKYIESHTLEYLQLPSSQQKYRLENFAYLRTVNDFSFRMTIISEELKKSFLSYSEQPLPCSLTRLSPQLSAVAVYIYSQMIRGIERSLFTYPEVVVKQLVTIGCAVTLLRDEILIQLVKQIRHHPMPEKRKRSNFGYDVLHGLMSPTSTTSAGLNSYAHIVSKVQQQQQLQQFLQQNRLNEEDNLDDEDNLIRFIEKQEQYRGSIFSLWRLLMICLFHFPPSAEFENFLELFLWEQYDHYTKIIASFNQRYQQLRPLGDETADSLKRKLERKPFSMTDSNPGASTSQSSATGGEENVIEITNELEYYLYKNLRTYSMRCLRYLHRSILVNGYHQPVDLHQSSDTVSYGEVGSERENKLLPGRPNHHQYSLFPGDEQPFPAIFHWLQEGKSDHELPSISLNANHLYYPSNNAKIAAKEYSNASDSLASLQKKQRKNIQIYTFESLIDPSLPIFLLADEFNELHLPLSKQEPFYLSPLSQIYQRSESLIHEQFTKALLIQNDFVTALGLSTKKGKESETRSSFSNSAIALTMKMIVASSKEQTAEKVDGDCHLLLLAGATIDLISSDPAFQRITEPADKIVFDEQLLLALNRPPSQPSLPQLQQQLQQPNNSSFQKQPTVSSPALSSLIRLRGTREDWISRFRLLQITGKEGNPNGARSGFINRNQFCNALAATITSKASNVDLLDRMDRDILYFLLFGKKLSNRPTIVREYRADYHVFHFFGADEYASCQLRRKWLDDHIAVPNSMSELMLSQLQSTDLLYAAERFWDLVVVKMSKECLQFPFMQFDEVSTEESSSPDKNIAKRGTRLPTSSSSTNNVIVPSLGKDFGEGNGVSFNWEIY